MEKQIRIYWHHSMGVAHLLEEEFRAAGIPVINHDKCLCDLTESESVESGVVLFHPEDHEDCYNPSAKVISRSPNAKFYAFCLANEAREKGLGEHSNLTYIRNGPDLSNLRKKIMAGEDISEGK